MPTWPHLLTGLGITALGLTLLAKVFAKPSLASSTSFQMVPGKRYEVAAAVSPELDPSMMEGFRQVLAAGGATNIRIGKARATSLNTGVVTAVVYNISPLAPLTLTKGQPLAFGGFMLRVDNVREL